MNKKILGSTLLFALILTILILPFVVLAQDGGGGGGGATLKGMAASVKQAAVDIATPIVVVGWIIAGILYLTAAGAPEKITIAKKAVIACTIGTVLVVLAIGSDMIIEVVKNAFGIQ